MPARRRGAPHARNLCVAGAWLGLVLGLAILPNVSFFLWGEGWGLGMLTATRRRRRTAGARMVRGGGGSEEDDPVQHVFLTTFQEDSIVTRNSLVSVVGMAPPPGQGRVRVVVFTNATLLDVGEGGSVYDLVTVLPIPRTNPYGFPVLKDMLLTALDVVGGGGPVDSLVFFNSDLIFPPEDFLDTIDALVLSTSLRSRFLGVGRRTNVKACFCSPEEAYDGTLSRFQSMLRAGTPFVPDAQDYFVMSPDLFSWENMPDLVVGRIFYDNYLTARAQMNGDRLISVVDLSAAAAVVHQSATSTTVWRSHRDGEEDNVNWNEHLIRKADPEAWREVVNHAWGSTFHSRWRAIRTQGGGGVTFALGHRTRGEMGLRSSLPPWDDKSMLRGRAESNSRSPGFSTLFAGPRNPRVGWRPPPPQYHSRLTRHRNVSWDEQPLWTPPPARRGQDHHVMFTTSSADPPPEQRFALAWNAQVCANMSCTFLVMSNGTRTNPHGFPFFRDLLQRAVDTVPTAATYTYFNADVVFSPVRFPALLHALARARRRSEFRGRRVWVSGRRHNWQLPKGVDVVNVSEAFFAHEMVAPSPLFGGNAMDYFTVERDTYHPLSTLRDVVVGRPAVDTYLLSKALDEEARVVTMDATLANPVVHVGRGDGESVTASHHDGRGNDWNVQELLRTEPFAVKRMATRHDLVRCEVGVVGSGGAGAVGFEVRRRSVAA